MDNTYLEKEKSRALNSIEDVLNSLVNEVEEKEALIDSLNSNVQLLDDTITSLENKVNNLEYENEALKQHVDELKLELLRAQKLIDDHQHDTLNNMYFSPDGENRVVAKEVINNLYKND